MSKRRRLSRWPASVAVALALLAVAGCAENTDAEGESAAPPSRESPFVPEDDAVETITVPHVSYEDGQDAVDAIEAEELTATHDEDDPAGCTVEDQDPVGGTEAEPGSEVVLTLDCSQRDQVADYCAYGAVSEAQLYGCIDHVTVEDIDQLDTNAAQYARGELSECLDDSGPYCGSY